MSTTPMPAHQFWAIIEKASREAHDPDAHMSALQGELVTLSPDKISAFQLAFLNAANEAYSWDLWGAAFVIHGGCSDDGFAYFRYWLVSRGQSVFHQACASPETLAQSNPPAGPYGMWEFEGIAYIAERAWQQVGGKGRFIDPDAHPVTPEDPTGEPFEEDDDHLMTRYPQLWDRFGETPLGG